MWRALFIGVLSATLVAAEDLPTVEIADQGRVVGSIVTVDDFEYKQFLGIPYAGSTAGPHRFKAPTAPPVFGEDFIADRANIKCIRPTANGFQGTEDCLVANVYVPETTSTDALPVMVWIEGGEFQNSEYAFSFKHLLEKDVIVVALNHRESIFGYLCLGVEQAPGNAGLKDIIAGLRWVQKNIVSFGGDPNSVTLFGHGSGAAAVDLITLSPLSEGLIHKAIAQSGSSSAPWAISYDPRPNAIAVAEKLGHIVRDEQSLADLLERSSVGVLITALKELEFTDNSLAFAACIENKELEDVVPLLTEPPHEIIVNGNYNQIPYMTGYVQYEGTIRAHEATDGDWLAKMEASFVEFLQQDLDFESEEEKHEIANEIRDFYFQSKAVDMSSISEYVRYHGDTMIVISAIRNAKLRAETSDGPVYLYQFSYEGPLGQPFAALSLGGATHGEDLGYLFDTEVTTQSDSIDTLVRDAMVQRWTNFAKNGVPTSEASTDWLPVTTETLNYLHITNNEVDELEFEIPLVNPQNDNMGFWEDIYKNHYREITAVWEVDSRDESDEDDEDDEGDDGTTPSPEDDGDEGEDGDGSPGDATRNAAILISVLTSSLLIITLS